MSAITVNFKIMMLSTFIYGIDMKVNVLITYNFIQFEKVYIHVNILHMYNL